jgi:glucose-6-phosphate 1-epimerase
MNIDQLNRHYGISGTLEFIEGAGGLAFISINNASAKALISLHGGQVLAFQSADTATDLLFLSNKANYDGSKAIRGGIPICWPWFGADPKGLNRPNHGFARNVLWSVVKTVAINNFTTQVTLRLRSNTQSKDLWPHDFDLTLEITIGSTLILELVTRNTGTKTFTISQALHAYFQISDINQIRVLGLEDKHYLDKLDQGHQKQQLGAITITNEVDRIYTEFNNPIAIIDPVLNRKIQIQSSGNKTTVVWNPWAKNSAKIADLNYDDYQRFVCVEASNAGPDIIEITAGQEHRLKTIYTI